jgi:hypothetical protein
MMSMVAGGPVLLRELGGKLYTGHGPGAKGRLRDGLDHHGRARPR